MAEEFTPITTQDALDAAISAHVSANYGDYEDLKTAAGKNAGFEKTIGEQSARIKSLERDALKSRIAHEAGLPYEMAARLTGETEKDIRADAQTLAKFVTRGPKAGPLKSTEPEDDGDAKTAAMRSFLSKLVHKD